MITENYINNFVELGIKKIVSENQKLGTKELEKLISDSKVLLKEQAKENVGKWALIGELGSDIHKCAEYFFNNEKVNIEELRQLLKYNIPESSIQALYSSLNKLKDYFKAKFGDEYKVFTEVKLHDTVSKTAGILDLVVIDNKGKAHIIDYKASYKGTDDWNSAKEVSMRYQMACYRQLLRNTGIDVQSVSIIPIKINDINYDTKTFESLSFENHQELLSDITSNKYQTVANDIIPTGKIQLESNDNVSKNIRDNLKKMFGYDVKSKIINTNIEWFKQNRIKPDDDGRLFFFDNETTSKNKRVYVDDSNIDSKIKDYFDRQENNQESLVRTYRQFISKCQKGFATIEEFNGKSEKVSFKIANIFGRYATEDWEVLDNDEADNLGIMMFRNKKTNIMDIVSITSNDLDGIVPLNIGSTILGNTISDNIAKRDPKILPSNNSSIEFMKLATFLNENSDKLSDNGISMGLLRVYSVNKYEANGITYDDLKYNFGKLCQSNGITSNLSKINKQNPYDLLLSRLDFLVNNVIEAQHKQFYSKKLENLQNNILSDDRIKELIDIQNELIKRTERSNVVYSDYHDLLNLVSQSLLFYRDIDVRFELDIKQWALNNSGMFTNPLSFSAKHKNIQQVVKLSETAMSNIRSQFVDYKEKTRELIEKNLRASGYSSAREYTVGDNVAAYDILFRTIPGTNKRDPRLLLKNPDDPNSDLNSDQKAFLRHFLTIINRNRYKTSDAENDAKLSLDYYGIPLIRGSVYTKLRGKSYKSAITDYWKNMFNFNDFFDEDLTISREKSDEMIEVFNQFENQDRDRMLSQYNAGDFETDLELVMDTYEISAIRKSEFNKVLPYINAIRIVVDWQSKGILSTNKNTLDYTKKYIRNAVYNDKMIDDNLETTAKFVSALKDLTSTMTLGFNVMSGVREFLQGQFGNITKMAAQHYGKDSFSAKNYIKATGLMLDDSSTFFTSLTKVEELNNLYALSGMDINTIVQKLSSSNKGVLAFRSRWGFWMNSGPEYFNRMTLFIAQMDHDGTFDAHEMVNGVLKYDMKKDGRFKNYLSGNTNNKDYYEEKALYLAMLKDFNDEGYNLKEGDMFPKAYTVNQRNSYKSFSDMIYGSYDHESKVMFENTIFGMMVMQFKKWIFAKKDQYLIKGDEYSRGTYEHISDENGNKLYYDTQGNITTDSSGTPVKQWTGRYMEGIFWSLKGICQDVWENKGDLQAIYRNMKENTPERLSNMKAAMYDMSIFLGLAIIAGCVDWDDLKQDKSFMASFYKTVLNSGNDLYVGNNIETLINSKNPIPTISYGINFKDSFGRVMSGDDSVAKMITSNIGMFRPLGIFVE